MVRRDIWWHNAAAKLSDDFPIVTSQILPAFGMELKWHEKDES
jgi:hypothetical protein